ncbi:hypothetical protein IW18_09380 [Flavobacterium hibernum]|uniref:Uncharacterized protein n=1 Tax=Flavobacterium hibernum TaxID=37752 RepID=A0A0D0EV33_9FLAO|nr:hypothetical protein IW18_09380 [Flavobacterium hibernum]
MLQWRISIKDETEKMYTLEMAFLVSILPVINKRSASARHFFARTMLPEIIDFLVISAKRSACL